MAGWRRSWQAACGVALLLGLFGGSTADAASGDADATYTVTVTKVEFRSSTTGNFITLFEGSRDINIASASAGAIAAGLVSGGGCPRDVYDQVRVTIGGTLRVRGYVNSDTVLATLYTDGGTDAGAFSANAGVANTPGADYALSSFTIPAENRVTTQNVSFTVGATSKTVRVTFDTSGVLTSSGGAANIGPPSVTMTSV